MLLPSCLSYVLSLALTVLWMLASPVHGASYSLLKSTVNLDNGVSLAVRINEAIDLLEAIVSLPVAQFELFSYDNNSLAIRHAIDLLNDATRELHLEGTTRRHLEEDFVGERE